MADTDMVIFVDDETLSVVMDDDGIQVTIEAVGVSGATGPQGEQGVPGTNGQNGIIAGSTGATDNRLLRSDGTGGATLQNSAISVDDSGNMSGAGISGSSNTITNLATSMFAANVIDTDGTLAANSDTRLATQKAVKTYADALIATQDAMVFKGATDCSANPNYPAADRGHTYRVSVAGKIGGASGVVVEAGDIFICNTDSTASGNQATVGANWNVIQTNLDGAVIGPASAADTALARYNGTTGKVIQDSAVKLTSTVMSPTANDGVALGSTTLMWSDLFLASGGVINFNNGDVTITHGTDTIVFSGAANGYSFSNEIAPVNNDGAPLGDTAHNWSDLFLASGAVINFANSNYTVTHSSGLLTLSGALTMSGALNIGTSNALTAGTIELGNVSDTTLSRSSAGVLAVEGVVVPTISSTNTFTNKRITPRVLATAGPGGTPSINTDNYDFVDLTALAAAITSMTTNLSGTPTHYQPLVIQFTDNGTPRAITWGTSFEAMGVALPTTTVANKRLMVGFRYSTTTSKWGCVASAQEA